MEIVTLVMLETAETATLVAIVLLPQQFMVTVRLFS
jgi:hypothetical protein